MTPYDMALAALAEVAPRAHFALAAAGPNRAGNPPVGCFGFMDDDDLLAVCRAVHLAHTRNRTDGWDWADEYEAFEMVRGRWPLPDAPPAVVARTHRAVVAYALAAIDPGVGGAPDTEGRREADGKEAEG